jgi:hypothetical protein
MKCNKTQSKWCINKHGASKITDTFETYHSPRRPLFIWTNHRAGLSSLSLARIFWPPDNPSQKWPRLSGLELLCSGKLEQKTDLCAWREMFVDEIGLG